MCGRLNVVSDPLSQFLMDVLGVQYDGEDNYNLAPMSQVPILVQREQTGIEVQPMQWWLIPYWADASLLGGCLLIGRLPPCRADAAR